MRLDHLLSKEHLARTSRGCGSRAALETFALEVVLTGGTLTSRPSEFEALLVQPACRWERGGPGEGGPGALLGPEGTGRSSEWTSPRWLRASAAADVRIVVGAWSSVAGCWWGCGDRWGGGSVTDRASWHRTVRVLLRGRRAGGEFRLDPPVA